MRSELSHFVFRQKPKAHTLFSKVQFSLIMSMFRDSLLCNKISIYSAIILCQIDKKTTSSAAKIGSSVPYFQHVRQLLSRRRHVIIILAHWVVHAYGILAVTLLRNPAVHGPLFSLVLSPVLFYLVTHSFTEPNKFKT